MDKKQDPIMKFKRKLGNIRTSRRVLEEKTNKEESEK